MPRPGPLLAALALLGALPAAAGTVPSTAIPADALCLEADCLLCLLGRGPDTPEVRAAVDAYDLARGGMSYTGRGLELTFGVTSEPHVYVIDQYVPGTTSFGIPVLFGLTTTTPRADVEAALPGGAWTEDWATKRPRWVRKADGIEASVLLDASGRVERVSANAKRADAPAIQARTCRAGDNPALARLPAPAKPAPSAPTPPAPPATAVASTGPATPAPPPPSTPPASGPPASAGDDDLFAAMRAYTEVATSADTQARFASTRAAAERMAAVVNPVTLEAVESLGKAARNAMKGSEHALSAAAADRSARITHLVNAHGEVSSVAYQLERAVAHLRRAIALCDANELPDESRRLAGIVASTERLRATIRDFYEARPSRGAMEGMTDAQLEALSLSTPLVMTQAVSAIDGLLSQIGGE